MGKDGDVRWVFLECWGTGERLCVGGWVVRARAPKRERRGVGMSRLEWFGCKAGRWDWWIGFYDIWESIWRGLKA